MSGAIRLSALDLPTEVIEYIKVQTRLLSAEIAEGKEKIAQLQEAEAKSDEVQKGYEFICEMLDQFNENYGNFSIPEQHDILRSVIDYIEWDGEKADIFPLGR